MNPSSSEPPHDLSAERTTGYGDQPSTLARDASECGAFSRRLGPYELLERIGHGGTGDVFRARQGPPMQRLIAVKVLRAGEEFSLRTFEKEIEVARRLRHPHLLPIYDAGQIEGEYYFTMPLLPRGSLAKRLRSRPVEPRWAAALLEKTARAVHYAHQQGVLHRDLKPGNILLDDNDEPLVADFGLAKLIDQSLVVTQTGQLLGTVPYMSPEQANGQGVRATPASDVWSLGVMLYEMLTEQRPFRGDNHSEILRCINRQEPLRPRRLRPDLPAELEMICLKCLEKDPAWRYSSAGELADDLRRWLDGLPLPEPSSSFSTSLRRALRRIRRLPVGVGVLTGCLALLLLLLLFPSSRSASSLNSEERALATLRLEEERARPGKPVILQAAGIKPRWRQMVLDGGDAAVSRPPNGPLTVRTSSIALLELLPSNPRRSRWRLTVQMRQTDSAPTGWAGIYWGRSHHRTGLGSGQAFASAAYCEPEWMIRGGVALTAAQEQEWRSAELAVNYVREVQPGQLHPLRQGSGVRVPFRPPLPGTKPPALRTLIVEVTPEATALLSDGKERKVLPRPKCQQLFFPLKIISRDLLPVRPEFSPSGGIGIVLVGGSADVVFAQWEPLGPAN